MNKKRATTEEKWREAVRICKRILSDRAAFDNEEINYKLEISNRVKALFRALEGEDFVPLLKRAFSSPNNLLAYCVSLGLPSGLLIYAGNCFSRSLAINRADIRLETAGIDLAAEPSAVLERTQSLARRLLKEAEATLNLRKAAG